MVQRGFPVGHPHTAPSGINYGSYTPIRTFELSYEAGRSFLRDSGPNRLHFLGENVQFVVNQPVEADKKTAFTVRGAVVDSPLPGVEPIMQAAFLAAHRQDIKHRLAARLRRRHAGFNAVLVPHESEI